MVHADNVQLIASLSVTSAYGLEGILKKAPLISVHLTTYKSDAALT